MEEVKMAKIIEFKPKEEKSLEETFDEIKRLLDPKNEYDEIKKEFREKYNTIDKALDRLDNDFNTLDANMTLLTNILIGDMEKRKIHFSELEEFKNIISINTQIIRLMIDYRSNFESLMKMVDYNKKGMK